VRKILTGMNNNENILLSVLPLNTTIVTRPVKKKISMFRFFLLLNPVEYIIPRKLIKENKT
jgi:hypothetical protein